jgi:uncharacterized protein (DUF952 family)
MSAREVRRQTCNESRPWSDRLLIKPSERAEPASPPAIAGHIPKSRRRANPGLAWQLLRVFHLAERSAWAEAEATGRYPWSSRGLGYEREGFVHCSFAGQVPGIVMNHYADLDPSELVVLEMDRDRLPILVEDLGQGPYPHCFAELTPADVLRTHNLPLDQ